MSESGQKRKSSVDHGMSALGGKADIDFGPLDVALISLKGKHSCLISENAWSAIAPGADIGSRYV